MNSQYPCATGNGVRGQIQAVVVEKQELCPLPIQRGQPWAPLASQALNTELPGRSGQVEAAKKAVLGNMGVL